MKQDDGLKPDDGLKQGDLFLTTDVAHRKEWVRGQFKDLWKMWVDIRESDHPQPEGEFRRMTGVDFIMLDSVRRERDERR